MLAQLSRKRLAQGISVSRGVLSQQELSVLFQQEVSVQSQQQTSVLSREKTSALPQQQARKLGLQRPRQRSTKPMGEEAWLADAATAADWKVSVVLSMTQVWQPNKIDTAISIARLVWIHPDHSQAHKGSPKVVGYEVCLRYTVVMAK